jgi:AraC-like DNA-binding protein
LIAHFVAELARPSARAIAAGAADFRVRRAADALAASATRLVASEVARGAGLSRAHFFTLFREAVGVSPSVFANALRIERAIHSIAQSRVPITDVGLDLGFNAAGNFTRFFRNNVGVAPLAFRTSVINLDRTQDDVGAQDAVSRGDRFGPWRR